MPSSHKGFRGTLDGFNRAQSDLRRNARKRKAVPINACSAKVTGGKGEHIVRFEGRRLICDCWGGQNGMLCCHVLCIAEQLMRLDIDAIILRLHKSNDYATPANPGIELEQGQ